MCSKKARTLKQEERSMAEIQWEYCGVYLDEIEGEPPNPSYNCQVWYFASAYETIEHQFTKLGSPVSFSPLMAAIRLLGEGGWELVSIQHATYQKPLDPQNASKGWWISSFVGQAMAYFKRPILPGRAINEPLLPSY